MFLYISSVRQKPVAKTMADFGKIWNHIGTILPPERGKKWTESLKEQFALEWINVGELLRHGRMQSCAQKVLTHKHAIHVNIYNI